MRKFIVPLLRFATRHSPDAVAYRIRYFRAHRRLLRSRPRRFTEKIYHRMRYPLPGLSILADKVGLHDYVAAVVGERYLVPTYLVTERLTVAQLEALPSSFVLKAAHAAGLVRVVRDKAREDLAELAALANDWLTADHAGASGEKHYAGIPPRILAEQALLTDGESPADYKFNVFNPGDGGDPFIFIQVINDRSRTTTQNLFLEDWTPSPFRRAGVPESSLAWVKEKPANLAEMLEVAKALARPFSYCRVDLYSFQGRVYVGEITFTPAGGRYKFDPPEWDEKLGALYGWPEVARPLPGIDPAALRSGT